MNSSRVSLMNFYWFFTVVLGFQKGVKGNVYFQPATNRVDFASYQKLIISFFNPSFTEYFSLMATSYKLQQSMIFQDNGVIVPISAKEKFQVTRHKTLLYN